MIKSFSKKIISVFIALLFLSFSACSEKRGLSLARSNATKSLSECQTLVEKKKYEKAQKCFESYQSRNQGDASAAIAAIGAADALFLKKDYSVAAESYLQFIEGNPYNEQVPYAYYRAGLSYLKDSPKAIDRNQETLDLAVQYLGTVVKYYSNSPHAAEAKAGFDDARLKQAKRHFYVAKFYYKQKEYLAAIPRFQTIVTDYSKLGLDEDSFFYLINSLKYTDQKEVAQKYFEVFQNYYPTSKVAKKIKL